MDEINKKIWSHLTTGDLDLKKLKLNQIEEIESLINTVSSLIERYNCKTNTKALVKTNSGYEMKRKCELKDCDSFWSFVINVTSGDGSLACNFRCNHFFSVPSPEVDQSLPSVSGKLC